MSELEDLWRATEAANEAADRLARERDALAEVTRKTHELITDAKAVRAELREDVRRLQGQVEDLLGEIVSREIAALSAANKKAMDDATARTFARFDKLTALLLKGPTRGEAHAGAPGIEEMVLTVDHIRQTEPGQIHEHVTKTEARPV